MSAITYQCGIATFTSDLLAAGSAAHPQSQCFSVSQYRLSHHTPDADPDLPTAPPSRGPASRSYRGKSWREIGPSRHRNRKQVRGCRGDDSPGGSASSSVWCAGFSMNTPGGPARTLNFLSANSISLRFWLWNLPAARRLSRSMNAGSESTSVSRLLTSRPRNKSSAGFVGYLPKGSVPPRLCLMGRQSV